MIRNFKDTLVSYYTQKKHIRILKKEQNVSFFSLKGMKMKGRVCHIYDGDTIHVIVVLNGKPVKFRVRMQGYDSPEMKPPLNQENRELEKEAALRAKKALSDFIFDQIVDIEFGEFDKYGRPLAIIFHQNQNVNQYMIQKGYGYEYNGGTKVKQNYERV